METLKSKKFIAFLVSEVTWKIIIASIMLAGMKWDAVDPWIAGIVMTVILVTGFVEAGYILGQASLDKYTRIAEIATNAGKDFRSSSVSTATVAKKDEP